MGARSDKQTAVEQRPAESRAAPTRFSFGARRYASTGPRRLFTLQECTVLPAFQPQAQRPHRYFAWSK
jgi:hypothetical protein